MRDPIELFWLAIASTAVTMLIVASYSYMALAIHPIAKRSIDFRLVKLGWSGLATIFGLCAYIDLYRVCLILWGSPGSNPVSLAAVVAGAIVIGLLVNRAYRFGQWVRLKLWVSHFFVIMDTGRGHDNPAGYDDGDDNEWRD